MSRACAISVSSTRTPAARNRSSDVFELRSDLLVQQFAEVRAGDGESQAAERNRDQHVLIARSPAEACPERSSFDKLRTSGRRAGRHVRGFAGGCAEQRAVDQPRVGDGSRERADVIQRLGQRHDPIGGDLAEARLEADDAAGGCGDANRSAGVGPDGGEGHPGRHADGRPSARAAGRSRKVVRVAGRSEGGILVGRAERKLVQVGFADEDRTGLTQMGDGRRIALGDVAVAHPRGSGRGHSADVDQILDGDRARRAKVPDRFRRPARGPLRSPVRVLRPPSRG